MYYEPKKIQLKNGATALLRSPVEADAEKLLDYLKTTAEETPFVLRYPEECTMTLEQERGFLRNILSSLDNVMIFARWMGSTQVTANSPATIN